MYRKNVCAFIFNENAHYLACLRMKQDYYQCVQGGVEEDDIDIVAAALREIEEEIGLTADDVRFVQEIMPPSGDPKEFRYELRPTANLRRFGFVGQQQRILLFFAKASAIERVVLVPPSVLHVQQEFLEAKWMPMAELQQRCPPEKHEIFRKVGAAAEPIVKSFFLAKNDAAL